MKARANKLDRFGERLDRWEAEGKTIPEMQKLLLAAGCSSSPSSISVFLARRRQAAAEEALLLQIATGARQIKAVESSLEKSPAPRFGLLMALFKTFVFKLSTMANVNPEMFELAAGLMKQVIEGEKLSTKREELTLDKERFRRETCELFLKWFRDAKAREIAESNASNSEKIARLRQSFFADVDEMEKSGAVQIPS